MTRPDVLFAAHNLAKYSDDPGPVHWDEVMKVLRYLWRTKDLGITYGGIKPRDVTMSEDVDFDRGTRLDN